MSRTWPIAPDCDGFDHRERLRMRAVHERLDQHPAGLAAPRRTSPRPAAALIAMGFSHSTCLPAAAP